MKRIHDTTGRFAYRPFYEEGELDALCEAAITSYMADHSGALTFPIPTERLITLIERDAAEIESYADLTEEGPDVNGLTLFEYGKKPRVFIDKNLSIAGGRQHRLRTTLAHEWGHVALHDAPFQEKRSTGSLFDGSIGDTTKCKRNDIIHAKKSDWIEWQAGYVCGALLMPKTHLLLAASRYCERYRCQDRIVAGTAYPAQLAEHISNEFQVSQEAALVRINKLCLVRHATNDLPLSEM